MFACSFGYYAYQLFYSPNVLVGNSQPRSLYLPPDTSYDSLQRWLYQREYVQNIVAFSFIARWMEYTSHVVAGHYVLQPNMSNLAAIRLLRSGTQTPIRVTFSHVRLLHDLPEKIYPPLAFAPDSLRAQLLSPQTAQQYGFTLETFPLMFIPNTYEVYWTLSTDAFLVRMRREYRRFWHKERLRKADSLGLTPVEVGIMASLLKAETNYTPEKKRMAGVLLNRLRRHMHLQVDPTAIFPSPMPPTQRMTYAMLKTPSPYNTYLHKGLPPGPIFLPDGDSMDAVLDAEAHAYLYYCARADFSGAHHFSTTYSAHKRYARQYQHALRRRLRATKKKK